MRRGIGPGPHLADVLARLVIGVGGIGTIIAVTLIMVFLVAVTLPLFEGAEVDEQRTLALTGSAVPLAVLPDEHGQLAAVLERDWSVRLLDLAEGRALDTAAPIDLGAPSAWALEDRDLVLGYPDGSVRLGRAEFSSRFLEQDGLDQHLLALAPGESRPHEQGLVSRTPEGLYRLEQFALTLDEPLALGDPRPVRLVDGIVAPGRVVLATLQGDDLLRLHELRERQNLLTRKVTRTAESFVLPLEGAGDLSGVERLLLGGRGDSLLLIADDGRALRWDLTDPRAPLLQDRVDLVPEAGATLAEARFLAGRRTLVVGDDQGRLSAWFAVREGAAADGDDGDPDVEDPDPDSGDPHDDAAAGPPRLTRVHPLQAARGSPVVSLAVSARTRLIGCAWADGRIALQHVTTERTLAEVQGPVPLGAGALAMAPREDALLMLGDDGLHRWSMQAGHPEAGLSALFLPIWYEGYPAPEHVWQSSSGSDSFEPKLGLWPLVFGTLKATWYSLLFGAPMALLAALFTSEFLPRRHRSAVKSLLEMMASLPSVVLGFLAGLVIAPFAAGVLPHLLVGILLVPGCLLTGAALWRWLPRRTAEAGDGLLRLGGVALSLAVAIALAALIGRSAERHLFGGDLVLWLDGGVADPSGGWVLLLLPLCGLLVTALHARLTPDMVARLRRGRVSLAYPVGAALTILLAFALGRLLGAVGLDPRGGVFGPFEVRNALVVGFVMGFAIIPIIFTLAEDALGSVPEHLRLASLAAGATPWQTAVRVVVPTAASGLFSAVMIGLGRAVGETMIVLMATGNTPIRDWNLFNGFRTLSANIAVELPEAVQGDTHYRTLFLAALVLFAMTFVLNTAAEVVRARVRRRLGAL